MTRLRKRAGKPFYDIDLGCLGRYASAVGVALVLVLLAVGTTSCGRSGGSGSEAAAAPPSSGDVWEIDPAPDRSSRPASVLAYVHGLHTLVLDGDDVFAGMTPLRTEAKPDGGRAIKLTGGLEAVLVPGAAGQMQLRFSTGEVIAMHKRQVK
jgi:hypothetical protein